MVFAQSLLTDGESIIQEVRCLFVFILISAVQSQQVIQDLGTIAPDKQNCEQQLSFHTDPPPTALSFSIPSYLRKSLVISGSLVVQTPHLCQNLFERQTTRSWGSSLLPECAVLVNRKGRKLSWLSPALTTMLTCILVPGC